jgi:glycosyltransferase involved in cell wall biosynthesis
MHGTPANQPLRIGFLLPADVAVGNRANGVVRQARMQAAALRLRGHDVLLLQSWDWQDPAQLDVLHVFVGGPALLGIERTHGVGSRGILALSPIIDSNQPFLAYRSAAIAGSLGSRLLTVPGVLRRQALASDLVVCRSRHEVLRVTSGLGVAAERTALVLNGADPPQQVPAEQGTELRRRLGLPEAFVLHVSAFTQPRKNALRMVRAAERLGYPLVIAGNAEPGEVLEELRRRAGPGLRLLGFVDATTKALLYASCRVFCLPSLHEGTGLAALEAGAYGCNVVITRNGGAPDYFGDDADYVDPFDESAIESALQRAWNRAPSHALSERLSGELTWERSALALERAYCQALARRTPAPGPAP